MDDPTGALAAANAIISFLGAADTTTATADSFLVPYRLPAMSAGMVNVVRDLFTLPAADLAIDGGLISVTDSAPLNNGQYPYVSFQAVMGPDASVPEPASFALLALGCVALASAKRSRRRNG